NSASATVNRIIDVFPKDQQDQIRTQLSTAVIGVLSQQLLPKKAGGRVASYEMMVVTPAVAALIRENKTYRIDSSIQTGRKEGMFLMDESLYRLWQTDACSKEEVLLRSQRPAEIAARIRHAELGALEAEDEEDEDEDEDEEEEFDDDDDRIRPGRGGARKRYDDDDEDDDDDDE